MSHYKHFTYIICDHSEVHLAGYLFDVKYESDTRLYEVYEINNDGKKTSEITLFFNYQDAIKHIYAIVNNRIV